MRGVTPQPELDAARFAAARHVRERGEIGRTIGDMDAVEQAVAEQPRRRRAQHRFRRRRDELHGAVAAMTRDHVAHVARQQAIAVFLDVEQRDAGARRATRRRRQGPRHRASPTRRRTPSACRATDALGIRRGGKQAEDGRARSGAPRRRAPAPTQMPPRGARPTVRLPAERRTSQIAAKDCDAAGRIAHHHDEAGERQRRQHMRAFIAAGARQEPG